MLIPVIVRLKDQAFASLKTIGGAAEFAGAETAAKQLPAAFVLPPASEKPGRNELASGGVSQRVQSGFAVAIAVPNVKQDRGVAAQDALTPVLEAVRQALVNWQPDAEHDPVELGVGQLLQISNGKLWWYQEFKTSYTWRKVG